MTHLYRTEAIRADAEFYFYGKITNAGGKDKVNIHINTDEYGSITIFTLFHFLKIWRKISFIKNATELERL
jgi:hypothetical protein